jgi:hypothetical protein
MDTNCSFPMVDAGLVPGTTGSMDRLGVGSTVELKGRSDNVERAILARRSTTELVAFSGKEIRFLAGMVRTCREESATPG